MRFEDYFSQIDNEEKAYTLGVLFGRVQDSNGLNIDSDIDGINWTVSLLIQSFRKKCSGKFLSKINISQFQNLELTNVPQDLEPHFYRGLFEANSSIFNHDIKGARKVCVVRNSNQKILEAIKNFYQIESVLKSDSLVYNDCNALDIVGKVYENSNLYVIFSRDKYEQYLNLCQHIVGITNPSSGNGFPIQFKWEKTYPEAFPPSKVRASDSGYDLHATKIAKQIGDVTLYSTGIKVQPDYGYYFQLVPRSSIIKSGYMLANSVGIIDRGYRSEILIALRKVNPNAKDLELPTKIAQLIPTPIIHMQAIQVDSLEATDRGEGGFGSTGERDAKNGNK